MTVPANPAVVAVLDAVEAFGLALLRLGRAQGGGTPLPGWRREPDGWQVAGAEGSPGARIRNVRVMP